MNLKKEHLNYVLIVNRIDPLCANKIDPPEDKNNKPASRPG